MISESRQSLWSSHGDERKRLTDKERHRGRNRETDRKTKTETNKETEKQGERLH